MPLVFFETELRQKIDELQIEHSFSDSTKNRLLKVPKNLKINWNTRAQGAPLSFHPDQCSFESVVSAWSEQKGNYLSHYSALYYWGLIGQESKNHYVSQEKRPQLEKSIQSLDEYLVRQAFLKSSRKTQNFFTFDDQKCFLIERQKISEYGVESKVIQHQDAKIKIRLTSPERTFVDSLISPQYSGGISTVVKAFVGYKFNVEQLIACYKALRPIYPYWQSIGLILEKLGMKEVEARWAAEFSTWAKMPFYLDHEAKTFWKFSETWQVAFPSGVFVESIN